MTGALVIHGVVLGLVLLWCLLRLRAHSQVKATGESSTHSPAEVEMRAQAEMGPAPAGGSDADFGRSQVEVLTQQQAQILQSLHAIQWQLELQKQQQQRQQQQQQQQQQQFESQRPSRFSPYAPLPALPPTVDDPHKDATIQRAASALLARLGSELSSQPSSEPTPA